MKSSKLLCILSALATALLVLSASVAAPILCRPFYYAHIAPLELTRYGLPAEEIRRAYGEMMDYCLGLRPDFAAGVLPASPEGAAHFADVRALFLLDLGVLVLSALVLAVLFAVGRRKKLIPAAPLGHGPRLLGRGRTGGGLSHGGRSGGPGLPAGLCGVPYFVFPWKDQLAL